MTTPASVSPVSAGSPEILLRLATLPAVFGLRTRLGAHAPRFVVEPALSSPALRLLSQEPTLSNIAADLGLALPERLTHTRIYDGQPRIPIFDLLADISCQAFVAPSGDHSFPGPEEGLSEECAGKLRDRGYEYRRMDPAQT